MFDSEALKAWYASNPTDMEWLEKPSWHQFRWRLPNNRWVTASRQMTNQHSLGKVLAKHGPRDVYLGTSSWLNPINLPKLSDEEQAHPILLDHLIVFDIDFRPFCYRRLEQARTATFNLLQWLDMHEELNLCSISFSGGKGFHLILSERDGLFFPSPTQKNERRPFALPVRPYSSEFWRRASPLTQPSLQIHGALFVFREASMEPQDGAATASQEKNFSNRSNAGRRSCHAMRQPCECHTGPYPFQ